MSINLCQQAADFSIQGLHALAYEFHLCVIPELAYQIHQEKHRQNEEPLCFDMEFPMTAFGIWCRIESGRVFERHDRRLQ